MRAGREKPDAVYRVYAFWGRFPGLYAATDWITFLGRHRQIRGGAVARLELPTGGRALEVACGTGRNLTYLSRAVGPQGRVTGLDFSPQVLAAAREMCRSRGYSNVDFVQGDAALLPVEGPFDGVLSILGISAIPGWESTLARCREVLAPGGRMVVCDARLFSGRLSFVNTMVRKIYAAGACWDPDRDIPGAMKCIFGNVDVRHLNLGTFYIAVSRK